MFQQNGLSLDQAPPISVVLRLFFAASIFGILTGFLILLYKMDIFDPSSIGALTITHTLTLGVMASFMLGALFQMLPVIAGVVLKAPTRGSLIVQIPFVLGTISLLFAFNLTSQHLLYPIASILLGGSLFGAIVMMLSKLLKVSNHSASSRGMIVALISLAITISLALYLTSSLSGYTDGRYYLIFKTLHYHFGLFGWITLLIFSISFQVIEMFYVTPPYPNVVSKYLAIIIFIMLIIAMPLELIYPQISTVVTIIFSSLMIYFAVLTLYRLSQRKRPIADATMWFWRLGLGSLIVSMSLVVLYLYLPHRVIANISSITFVTFALSVVFAMFYKIVPFLTWFHLNAQGYYKAPMMHEVIHPKTAKKHFWIHLSTVVSLLLSPINEYFIYIAGILTIVSFGWVSYQIINAHLIYKKIEESGERFDMGNFN